MKDRIRIIVAGTREFTDYERVKNEIDDFISTLEVRKNVIEVETIRDNIEIISGLAEGPDMLGKQYAEEHNYPCAEFPADRKRYGKPAGCLRNKQMASYAMSDNSYPILLAFWDERSRGTKNMINIAKYRNFEIHVVGI